MTAAEREVFTTHTGRTAPPDVPAREAWVAAGRRSGKSRIAALVATYCACFTDHRPHLAAGEVGTLPVIAADRQQARNVFRYIRGLLATPMLRQLVVNETRESVELSTRVVIEVHTASFRAVRGLTLVGAILDEVSFWNADEAGANPDVEVLHALRPGLAMVPGAVLLGISSPYARRGVLWQAYRKHFAQDGAVLVWRGDSATMNPTLDPQRVAEAYQDDPAAAASSAPT